MKKNTFKNLNILITGGTGSFGKNFISSLLKNENPKKIIVFSRDEFKQYNLEREINDERLRLIVGDVRDFERLNIACNKIDVLVHAAALKHVPIAEKNPIEYIKTNIMGADNVIKASLFNKIKKVIALSTDKAALPINLYGTTKLASDKLFISANFEHPYVETKFSVVRYGNVINSRGSILPLLRDLKNNKSKIIPITNEKMTRFWISLDEGVNFVKYCFNIMKGGEIFVPKLKSIKTIDLAKEILPSSKVKIIGIRDGEKIDEVLCPNETSHLTMEYKKYYAIFHNQKELRLKSKNNLGENGKKVKPDFNLVSSNKNILLNKKQIKDFVKNYL